MELEVSIVLADAFSLTGVLELNSKHQDNFLYLILVVFIYVLKNALICVHINGAKNMVPFLESTSVHGDVTSEYFSENKAKTNVLGGLSSHFHCVHRNTFGIVTCILTTFKLSGL